MAINTEPIIGTVWGWYFGFQELPTIWVYISGVLIIGALLLSAYDLT